MEYFALGITLPMAWPHCSPVGPDSQRETCAGDYLDDRFTPNTGRSRGGDIGGLPLNLSSLGQIESTYRVMRHYGLSHH
jgi:hypothetical protein